MMGRQRLAWPTLRICTLAIGIFTLALALRVEMLTALAPGDDAEAERAILMALYEGTSGDQWLNNSGWGTDEPHCNWYGVTCDASGLVSLGLSHNSLVGTLPPELGELSSLGFLSLSQNYLRGSIPAEMGHMAALYTLDLSRALLQAKARTNARCLSGTHLARRIDVCPPAEVSQSCAVTARYLWCGEGKAQVAALCPYGGDRCTYLIVPMHGRQTW